MQIRPFRGWCSAAMLAVALNFNPLLWGQGLQIECLAVPKQNPEKIELLVGNEKTVEVTLQSHALTKPLQLPRMPLLKFGKSSVNAEGKFEFTTYGSVKPLAGARNQLVLLMRKGQLAANGLTAVAIDSSQRNFGASKMMFMNLTRSPIRGVVGGKKLQLTPGKHAVLTPTPNRGKNLYYATLEYPREGKWRSMTKTNWPVLKDARGLVFVYTDPRTRRPRIHSIMDSLRKLPTPAE